MNEYLLTIAGVLPAIGAIIIWLLPGNARLAAKLTGLCFSIVELALIIGMTIGFKTGGARYQYTIDKMWIKQFGIHYALGIDGIALVLILMTVILVPVVILASWHTVDTTSIGESSRKVASFFALVLILEAMLVFVFAAQDVFLFYVFFEAMLIPMYFLIGSFGGPQRSYAAMKFLLYSLLGGLFMLAAIVALYVEASKQGHATFYLPTLMQTQLSHQMEIWLFLGFFLAFAIKAPLWPFHTWLPDATAEAPIGAAVLMLGVMDKVGTFGFMRYNLTLFPYASKKLAWIVIVLAVVGILYGALCAIGQKDLKRLVAYTSISHFGFIALGIFVFTSQGQSGATLYMVNHGFSTGALLFIVGFLISRRGSTLIEHYGGVAKVAPWLAGTFLVAGLSSLALPGTNSFVSEFLVLVGSFGRYRVAAIFATIGIVLAAIYILWLYQRTMTGEPKEGCEKVKDLGRLEAIVIAPMIALILVLGFYPKPALDIIKPAVTATMVDVGATDPAPMVQAGK